MSNKISHSGVIQSIKDGCIKVQIVQTSACAACKVASSCRSASPLGSSKNASESKVKIVDVLRNDTKGFEVGQQVVVWASKDVANQALLLGFGVPFLLLVCVLMIALKLTDSEGVSALAAIASLVPYYVALWLMRDRIQQRISFDLED